MTLSNTREGQLLCCAGERTDRTGLVERGHTTPQADLETFGPSGRVGSKHGPRAVADPQGLVLDHGDIVANSSLPGVAAGPAAVAEPRRRDILGYLALSERSVGDVVEALSLEQPSVSKHLRVLREVGLVHVRREGRRMLYRTNAEAIRPLHEWTERFQRLWRHQLERVKERAEQEGA